MPIKILHIGVGRRGSHWIEYVGEHPDALSVACIDCDSSVLENVKARFGNTECRYFTDLAEALRTTEADAAIVASPSALHAEHAIKALRAGLAVMVEKPFARHVAEARGVVQEAETAGKPLMVAENYRYWPAERTVRKYLQEGLLGRIDNVVLIDRRYMPSHTEGPWMATIDYPQLGEIAIHHFDSLRSFLGVKPVSIAARVWNPPCSDYKHGACTEAMIDMEGIHVQYLGTMASSRYAFSLRIEGEKGDLWTNRKYVFWRARGKRFFRPLKNVKVPAGDEARYPKGGTTSLLNSLRDAIWHGQLPETSGYDNLWTLAMVEAGKRSDREQRTVAIDEIMAEA